MQPLPLLFFQLLVLLVVEAGAAFHAPADVDALAVEQ